MYLIVFNIMLSIGIDRSENFHPNNHIVRSSCITLVINHCPPNLEFIRIEEFFGDLFHDPDFDPPRYPPLEIPFDTKDIMKGLSTLPISKALPPNGLPAVVWKTLANSGLVTSSHQAWQAMQHPKSLDPYAFSIRLIKLCRIYSFIILRTMLSPHCMHVCQLVVPLIIFS